MVTPEDKAVYATIRKALDLLDYHVGCGNLTDEESAIYEAADEALAWLEKAADQAILARIVVEGGVAYEETPRMCSQGCGTRLGYDGCSHPY
jgi:hypothetical protein